MAPVRSLGRAISRPSDSKRWKASRLTETRHPSRGVARPWASDRSVRSVGVSSPPHEGTDDGTGCSLASTRRGTCLYFARFGMRRRAVLHSGGQRPARPIVALRQPPPQTVVGARRCPQAASRPRGGLRGTSRSRFLQRGRGCLGEVVAARSVRPSPSARPSSTGEGRRAPSPKGTLARTGERRPPATARTCGGRRA